MSDETECPRCIYIDNNDKLYIVVFGLQVKLLIPEKMC